MKHIIGKTEKEEKATEPFRDWGPTGTRNPQGATFYPIYVSLDGERIIGIGNACGADFHPGAQNIMKEDCIEVYPVGDDGIERKWVFARDSVSEILEDLYPVNNNGTIQILRDKSKGSFKTVWTDKKFYANIYGSKLLNNITGTKKFDFPKSLYTAQECIYAVNSVQKQEATVLDFFAGSGTTGHAVIDLNRKDNGKRKYILIEMGTYFDTVTHPRIKKVVYCSEWKDGKPQERNTGIPHIMKYMKLESYEDALTNIALDEQKHGLLSMFGDEYLINYMLDIETEGSLLDVDSFKAPFEYKLKVTEHNETKIRNVDLVETFNYLIGLTVNTASTTVYFNAEKDDNGEYEGAVRLVKDSYGKYGFKQIEGTTPDGKRVLIIWRTISDDLVESNAALDAYFSKYRINPLDREYDLIYVNGDNNLQNICNEGESWKVQMTELEFKKRMFEEE